MNKISVFLCTIVLAFGMVEVVNASLVDNVDGTITQTRDDESRLMWFKNANFGDRLFDDPNYLGGIPDAQNYIDSLNAFNEGAGYAGYNNWRLPSPFNRDGSGPCSGNSCAESELGYMFYIELQGTTSGGIGTNSHPVENLMEDFSYLSEGGCFFNFGSGQQYVVFYVPGPGGNTPESGYVWPVRDMAPVPIPGAVWLLGTGLLGLVGIRRKFRKA